MPSPGDVLLSPGGVVFPPTERSRIAIEKLEQARASAEFKKSNESRAESNESENEKNESEIRAEFEKREREFEREMERVIQMNQEIELKRIELEERLRATESEFEQRERAYRREIEHERAERAELMQTNQSLSERMRAEKLDIRERELELRERELQLQQKHIEFDKTKSAESNPSRVGLSGSASTMTPSTLPIKSPACNVINDLLDAVELPAYLHNDKLGISTVLSMFEVYTAKFPSLVIPLSGVADGMSIEYAIQRFTNEFKSLVKVKDESTMARIKILALSKINDSLATKVRTLVTVGAAAGCAELVNLTEAGRADGKVPVFSSEFKILTLTQLPGMVELAESDSDQQSIHWKQIGEFVLAVASFERNRKAKLAAAIQQLLSFKGNTFTDFDLFMAEYERSWDICSSWKLDFESDYDKLRRARMITPEFVRVEYADTPSEVDELDMEWDEFRAHLSDVWRAAVDKEQLKSELGLSYAAAVMTPAVVKDTAAAAAVAPESTFKEIRLICEKSTCDQEFKITVKQQENAEKDGKTLSRVCPKCRGQICRDFAATGECRFGDTCMYLHSTENAGLAPGSQNKTCKHWKSGNCILGDKCPFQHTDDTTAELPAANTDGRTPLKNPRRVKFNNCILKWNRLPTVEAAD